MDESIAAMYFQCSAVSNIKGIVLESYRCNVEHHLLMRVLIDVSNPSVCKVQVDASLCS